MADVPMTHPASVIKNPDGTYSVRVQHTVGGEYSDVPFTNRVFGEIMANGYAASLNAKAVAEAKLDQIATDLGPAVADAKADVKKLYAEAEAEAEKLIAAAKTEAGTLKADALSVAASVKAEAETLKTKAEAAYSAAEVEAKKLITEAEEKASEILAAAAAKVKPAPKTEAPKSSTVEDE